MNKRELVEVIAEKVDSSKTTVEDVLDQFMDTVGETLRNGDRVALTGFGTFERRERAARTGQNPQTGEKLQIKATTVPAFKPGQGLRDKVAPSRGAAKKSAKKAAGKKAAGKKAAGKKAAGKKAAGKKAAGKKAGAKKAGAKKAGVKKATEKKTVKKVAAPAKKSAAKKTLKKSLKRTGKKA